LKHLVIWAGLVGVLAAGEACGGASHAAPDALHIEVHHSRYVPDKLSVSAGQTVRIVVRNADPIDHELIVGDQITQDRHENGADAHHDGSVPGEISVPAGAEVATTYRFDEAGELVYGCHLPGHWAYGMRGVIRVTA
jgi:uncharacterized cupredoxin-like copper-binding protein